MDPRSALRELVDETSRAFMAWSSDESIDAESIRDLLAQLKEASRDAQPEIAKAIAIVIELAQSGIASGIAFGDGADAVREVSDAIDLLASRLDGGAAQMDTVVPELDPEIVAGFIDDRLDTLDEIDDHCLELEASGSAESLAAIKRYIHSIKGESALLSLGDVARVCHSLEDDLASGDGAVDPATAARLTVEAVAKIRVRLFAIAAGDRSTPIAKPAPTAPETRFAPKSVTERDDTKHHAAVPAPLDVSDVDPELAREFLTEAREHLESVDNHLLELVSATGADAEEGINAVFRAFHTIKGLTGFLNLSGIMGFAHEAEALLDRVRSKEIPVCEAVVDASFKANDLLKAYIAALGTSLDLQVPLCAPSNYVAAITALLEAPGRAAAANASTPRRLDRASDRASDEASDDGADDGVYQGASVDVTVNAASAQPVHPQTLLKVDAHRLDDLVDMVGELVIAQSMVSQSQELKLEGTSRLSGLLAQLDKITRELQELAMSLRMVPIRATFRRMARLARDVSKKLGKDVTFTTTGDDTELDKSVVDLIGDPLVHMVRNAIDHGIETSSSDRERAGKPRRAHVELRAFHEGGCIHIELVDDGRGMDRAAILAKAREKGIYEGDGAHLSDSEVWNLLFAPGFSTAAAVTDVSGRGVGLDVVKRNVECMRGRIEIRSKKGEGSVFTIKLPLTLAIIDGMVVRAGGQRYVVPTLSIVRMFRPIGGQINTILGNRRVLEVGDNLVPVHRLADLFGLASSGASDQEMSAVVVQTSSGDFAFLVDELIGQQQIVIKPLGNTLSKLAGVAGGAVMPDGTVGLILDATGLVAISLSSGSLSSAPSVFPKRTAPSATEVAAR